MHKQELMKIWKEVFMDSDDFIQLFFDRVYREENVQWIKEDGRIISSLHMVPYKMAYKGIEIPVSYICGAATDPAARSKGLMKQVLNQSFTAMKKRGIPLAVLIPAEDWLYDYYQRIGFTDVFHQTIQVINRETIMEPQVPVTVQTTEFSSRLFDYFDKKQRERTCSILHDKYDFETICLDHKLAGALLITAEKESQLTGLLFAIPNMNNNTIFISEHFADSASDRDAMLHEAFRLLPFEKASIRLIPTNDQHLLRRGMLKIVDREKLTNILNQGGLNQQNLDSISDEEFLQLLFHVIYPYMNLMLD